ncbi:MAG: hypothetical protein LBV58_02575 [Acholeplasmatales bacterium]|jgi:7,8-dihydro-6-hydroxymethylpterin-pyrophosphokinase|nr:hypothetical protein [Acholeplasmatales bacterium]
MSELLKFVNSLEDSNFKEIAFKLQDRHIDDKILLFNMKKFEDYIKELLYVEKYSIEEVCDVLEMKFQTKKNYRY